MANTAETSTLPNPSRLNLADIRCIVFDFGFTLSSDHFFTIIPAGYPQWTAVIQENIFRQESVVIPWMTGDLGLVDIAKIVSQHIDLPLPVIVALPWARLYSYEAQSDGMAIRLCPAQGRKTALVTANMDVFTRIVVPSFTLILSSMSFSTHRTIMSYARKCYRIVPSNCLEMASAMLTVF
jgi:hypothetical protein